MEGRGAIAIPRAGGHIEYLGRLDPLTALGVTRRFYQTAHSGKSNLYWNQQSGNQNAERWGFRAKAGRPRGSKNRKDFPLKKVHSWIRPRSSAWLVKLRLSGHFAQGRRNDSDENPD